MSRPLNLRCLAVVLTTVAGAWLSPDQAHAKHPWDASSNIVWEADSGPSTITAPALDANGIVYISAGDGRLLAINPGGTRRWQLRTDTQFASSPSIATDGTIYVGCRDRKLYAVTPQGKIKWTFKTGAWVDATAAIGLDGTIYFGSWDKKFYALTPDGTVKWTFTTGAEILSSAAIGADGTIYFGSDDKKLYALNPDGTKRWEYLTGGQIISSPALDWDGVVYLASIDGKLHAVNPDGTARWVLATGGITPASPVINPGGLICIGVNKGYWGISPDGTKKWSGNMDLPVDSTAAITKEGTIFVASRDFGISAVSPVDGSWLWVLGTETANISPITIGPDGLVYIATISRRMLAAKGGTGISPGPWPMFGADPQHTGRVRPRP